MSTEIITKNTTPPVYNNTFVKGVKYEEELYTEEELEYACSLYPEQPQWLVSSILNFTKKNPHYVTTGCLGKKPPTSKEIREAKKLQKQKPPRTFVSGQDQVINNEPTLSQDFLQERFRLRDEQWQKEHAENIKA